MYQTIVEKFALDENAEPVHGDEWTWLGAVVISDKDGKILYTPQYDEMYWDAAFSSLIS